MRTRLVLCKAPMLALVNTAAPFGFVTPKGPFYCPSKLSPVQHQRPLHVLSAPLTITAQNQPPRRNGSSRGSNNYRGSNNRGSNRGNNRGDPRNFSPRPPAGPPLSDLVTTPIGPGQPFVKIETAGVPVHIFASSKVEPDAVQQLVNLAQTKIPVGYVSAMPDVHLGKGATIGSVFASEKYVSPNAVGVDIGCGMTAVPTDMFNTDVTRAQLEEMQARIKKHIPTGFNWHKRPVRGVAEALDTVSDKTPPSQWLIDNILGREKTQTQVGSLGGGNHFLEVVYDEDERIWLMLHSGSRFAGNFTAETYDLLAQEQMKKRGELNYPKGLAYLDIESEEGQRYLQDMLWCQGYAFQNRQFMLDSMMHQFCDVTGGTPLLQKRINVHHNFCQCESCTYVDKSTGKEVTQDLWVTRKGATSARIGEYGIIPGSMGVGSYIVKGKGNPDAWNSCSHGAGRTMSRTKAHKAIDQKEFEALMDGIVCDTNPKVKDEAPQAYKDLDVVMKDQETLVDIAHRLKPLVNVKGF